MFPGINKKTLEKAMKRLGMKQEEIPAKKVIIECSDKNIIIENPHVSKINAMGQETIQIIGNIKEEPKENFTEEDIKLVMEKTNKPYDICKDALKKTGGDLSEAILLLQ